MTLNYYRITIILTLQKLTDRSPIINLLKEISMFKSTKTICAVLSCLLVGACASPTVVEKQKANDYSLSCADLEYEMAETEKFRRSAESEKGVTATNAAAFIFFWPAMLATYSNVSDAVKAADETGSSWPRKRLISWPCRSQSRAV